MIHSRVSAGSMTLSSSNSEAVLIALPWAYMAATISSYLTMRSSGSSIAASSSRRPSLTAPSRPMPPNSPVGQEMVKNGA